MGSEELEEGLKLNINFEKLDGLIPAIAQDIRDGRILMMAYANREALEESINSKMATFWSRSRSELWKKGATSGDFLKVIDVLVDCDQDTVVYMVEPQGKGACHTKDPKSGQARLSCFYRRVNLSSGDLEMI
ncbi:MAG TPA: phosphoribosyl-AMP cyclohydrolase [Nitrospinota bacterium]|nr:phosphoribosyl-AMP cyclohydrolase [Nitrospinota bacterium]